MPDLNFEPAKKKEKIDKGLIIISFIAAIFLFLFAGVSCATVRDCSAYRANSGVQCVCIRENGDHERAKVCNKKLLKHKLEELRARCYRRCYDDCEKCEELR